MNSFLLLFEYIEGFRKKTGGEVIYEVMALVMKERNFKRKGENGDFQLFEALSPMTPIVHALRPFPRSH